MAKLKVLIQSSNDLELSLVEKVDKNLIGCRDENGKPHLMWRTNLENLMKDGQIDEDVETVHLKENDYFVSENNGVPVIVARTSGGGSGNAAAAKFMEG